jgi:hypothetical protein
LERFTPTLAGSYLIQETPPGENMEQAIATLIQNAAISALSLIAIAPALWLALMAIYGATLAVAHYNK